MTAVEQHTEQQIANLIRERDQARARVVELEQENAMLRDDLADWRLTQ